MFAMMIVNLYSVRVVLQELGDIDYGIYNVVGSIVTMFAFLSNSLASASQRYFSVELSKNNFLKVNQLLCLNIIVFGGIALAILLIAETVGTWFLNVKMVIPANRLMAANIVFQISLITFVLYLLSIPFNALIVAHEKMSAFSIISIVEAILKLTIALSLPLFSFDKLISYGVLLMIVSSIVTCCYYIYCRSMFEESRVNYYWNKREAKDFFYFSGWHFLGTSSDAIRSQGINILINLFFNPAVNAARAVSYQILSAINQLSANFFTAVKPQIYKSYATNNIQAMHKLIMRTTIMCVFLTSLIVFPVLSNTGLILDLWLKSIPEYAIAFTHLILINGLIESINGPIVSAALATGNIKKYEIIVSSLILLNLPVSYFALRLGCDPTITIKVSICLSIITIFARVFILRGLISFPFIKYLVLLFRLTLVSFLLWFLLQFILSYIVSDLIGILISGLLSVCLEVILYWCIVLDRADRVIIWSIVTKKMKIISK